MSPIAERRTIESLKTARVFEHPQSRRILLSLVGEARSLRDLERLTGSSLSLLHYHTGRLVRLGLVEITGEDKRPGRAVKRYRATAQRFFVPVAMATDNVRKALARDLRKGLDRDAARRGDEGVEYSVGDDGEPRMRRIGADTDTGAFELWRTLLLTSDEARSLGAELSAVLGRYAGRNAAGAGPHLVYCASVERL